MQIFVCILFMVIATVLTSFFVKSFVLGVILSGVAGMVGYIIGGFLRYTNMSGSQLLKYHGPHSNLTTRSSINEIEAHLPDFAKDGLLERIERGAVAVTSSSWSNLEEADQLAFCQMLHRYQVLKGMISDTDSMDIVSEGRKLHTYMP